MENAVTNHTGEIKLGLENITALMKRLDNPEHQLKIIHVAGTNGKGSVCQMMGSMLQEAGYTVGSFNSPHFITPEECIQINQQQIIPTDFKIYMEKIKEKAQGLEEIGLTPSFFELLTALGLLYFKEQGVDFVILEVGLGGALDATNVISQSIVSVLTKISIDHKDFLGDTLEAIAIQKAGIIRSKGLVVAPTQEQSINQVIQKTCQEKQAELKWVDTSEIHEQEVSTDGTSFVLGGECYQLKMIGKHQAYNAAVALKVIRTLRDKSILSITEEQIKTGLNRATWQGRFEPISKHPLIFIDGAHNVDGIIALADTLKDLPRRYTIGIVGILRDKEVDEMLSIISPQIDQWIITEPHNPRAMTKEELFEKVKVYHSKVQVAPSIIEAVDTAIHYAQQKQESQIIAFGSLYMIGNVRSYLVH